MTLITVILLGLGAVLIVSAIETDPTTGKSVSVLKTIQEIWDDQINFGQPAGPPAQNGGNTGGGTIPTDPNNPAWTTSGRPGTAGATPLSYQQAAMLAYTQQQHQRGL